MQYDHIIVGAGVIGTSTAYYLAKRGEKVLVLEQFDRTNEDKSSSGYSRIFRLYYDDDNFYTQLASKTLPLWKDIEQEAGEQLLYNTGALLIGEGKDSNAMAGYQTLKEEGLKTEILRGKELTEKYPQFDIPYGVADYTAGFLDASKTVTTFLDLAEKHGAEIQEDSKALSINNSTVELENSEVLESGNIIVTAGPWTKKLLPGYNLPLKVTKQDLLFIRPENAEDYLPDSFPVYSQRDINFYGIPIYGSDGVKIARHMEGIEVDPDEVEREIEPETVDKCRDFFRQYLPELADGKIVESKVCLYTNTPDHDFILDRLEDNLLVGAGFSGHGFKFAPMIGTLLADLAQGKEPSYNISRFRLDRFQQ